ncbi:teneurin-m isoform X1 [Parasteatoda tepidariorum]|uniref:teneurin-m isoform X1 n=4 Tax=Parasteatoda tepidariorum TaxID=114398 RepID=UPI001C72415C|nr:teneurin-m isoform X3 [Parasteatoda tepidariorum]
MDQFRPQSHNTRLRAGPRDPDDRSYSGTSSIDQRTRAEEQNAYETFEERRRSYDDPYQHRSRSRLNSRQKSQDQVQQPPSQQPQYAGGHHFREAPGDREDWDPGMLGSDQPRRLHQQLSGLSSSNSSDDEDAINSDATYTGSEVALARDSTLVLPCRRLMDNSSSLVTSHKLSMGKTGSKVPQSLGANNNALNTGDNIQENQLRENEQDFASCLARTPSGSIFIPSDVPKLSASAKKSDTNASHGTSHHVDSKNPERCHMSYPSTASVPGIPVRNNLRRPLSSRFSHSRFQFRKTLSSRCSWKCTAIIFIFLSLVLLTSLAYFIAVAVLNWQYANKHPCPVMIEDMGRTSDGTEIKSMYPLCKCNKPSEIVPHIRKIREAGSTIINNPIEDYKTIPTTLKSVLEEHGDVSSGEAAIAEESPDEVDFTVAKLPNAELNDDYLIPLDAFDSNGKSKREKFPIAEELRLRDDSNNKKHQTPIQVVSSPEALIQDASALLLNHFDRLKEESVIDPPILLPKSSEVSDIYKYPEYEQVDKYYPSEQPSVKISSTTEEVQEITMNSSLSGSTLSESFSVSPFGGEFVSGVASSTTEGISVEDKNVESGFSNALSKVSTYSNEELDAPSEDEVTHSVREDSSDNLSLAVTTASVSSESTFASASENLTYGPSSLPSKTLPPTTETFSEIYLGKTYARKVDSFGHWNIHFQQHAPSLVKFNYSLPEGASVGVYGRRNGIPTHTRYDFVEILDTRKKDSKRSTKDSFIMEFVQFLDQGSWYISVYNDGEQPQQVAFIPNLTDQTSLPCPYDCHGHGTCVMGSCICEPDFAGESCSSRVCPVLCSGRGHYVNGECLCSPSWKGKECQLREDECEISDCNGHGDCIDGICHCFPGYKGFHCEEVDCLDPACSEHGTCANGMCICRKGWKGADCGEPDSDSLRCLPDCSEHGHFDVELQRCVCDNRWSGPDCSQERCDLDCGYHGHCQGNVCICDSGWSGPKCNEKQCDPRCLENGQCVNGTCICIQGWNGYFCTLEGCPQNCNRHGTCTKVNEDWQCKCDDDWSGGSCNIPLEKICDDKMDNDNDGLIDCADSECCKSKVCENNPLCFSSPSPLDILLRKQPPAVTASFFQRMQFLIEDGSVQSYANKAAFNETRAAVIRGCVVSILGNGLKGVRVSVRSDYKLGFTITRDTGWFDLMVNGGGAVNLEFQRDPFKPHEHTIVVPWNEIVVVDKITMKIKEDTLPDYRSNLCMEHDYDVMKPVVLATWKHGFQGGCAEKSAILVESQVVQESLAIPGTNLHLVYHSSRMGGYLSTIQLRLTPDEIPPSLRFIHLRISIEGILFDKTFEAAPAIKFTYSWDRRNIYRQKVYGAATATVFVGYEYGSCPHVIWEVQTTQVSGHDMSISEIGGWNLDIHHRYNFHEGILQKGDGTNIYLKNKPRVLVTTMGDGHQRAMHCHQCDGVAKKQRLLAPVALAAAPDGSLYVGDFNLIRRVSLDGHVATVVELSAAQVAYRYHLAVGPADGKLYISDPEKHQVFRAVDYYNIPDVKNNIEAIIGNGGKCLPGDKMLCGDGRKARDAKLAYPKGLAVSAYGEIYVADGTNIRMMDRNGIIHTIIGDHYHKSHWKPFPCGRTVSISQVHLRWPTELAINPLDNSLHILDDHIVLRLTPDKRLKVIAGRPMQCPILPPSAEKSDIAIESYLESPQSISFSPSGDLYIAESDSQLINRVRVVSSEGRIVTYAGAESKCSCLDINCKCFDEDHNLAAKSQLSTISSIALTPDGCLHICDQGNLRIRSVVTSLPKANEVGEFHIYSSETQEIYIFNRHGQHVATKNILTGKTMYLFSYNVNTSLGKLSTVTDEAGNKIYILRDYTNRVNTIENTQGGKCLLEISRMQMLQRFTTPDNFKTSFEYQGSTGLLKSKLDSSRKAFVYNYDSYGRLVHAVTPTGQIIKLIYNLSIKGASVTVLQNDKELMSLLIRGLDVSRKTGLMQQRITQYQDGSLILALEDSKTIEMETAPSPVITDQNEVLGEIFPVPTKVKATLSDDVIQRFEWKYYLRREGKGKNRQITQVGRKMKVNGEILVAVEFDREQYSEIVYDKNQIPLVTVHYDELGRPIQWQPSQNITPVQLKYDKFGRLERWERGLLSEHYSFDINGRLADVRFSDSSGFMYKYDDNLASLPTEVILPSGSRYLLQYDSVGSLQNINMPNGHKHEIAIQISFGFYKLLYLSPGVKFPYVLQTNEFGQILLKRLPKNKGRVLYKYDEGGMLTTLFCGNERTDFTYYEHKSLLKSVVKMASGLEVKMDYRYHGSLLKEERHRFSSRSGMDGAKFKYVYDGRLSSAVVEINGKSSSEIKYRYNTETGILEQIQHFIIHRPKVNSIFIQDEMRQYSKTIGLDAYGRIVVLAVTLWNKEIYSLNLKYDNRNRVKQSHMKIGREGTASIHNYNYTLDGFLEEVSGSDRWKYSYDINGNLNSVYDGQHQLSLRYDDSDRLLGYGDSVAYIVDDRGYIAQRGEEKFSFNADGQLTHAFQLHQYETFYYYDHKNRLIARKDHKGNVTQFFYSDPLHENRLTHLHYPKDEATFIYIYDSSGHLMYIQQDGLKYYVASDHLGSPVALFNAEGVIIKEMSRTPFGRMLSDNNPDFYLPIDFQGGIRDPLTNLIHYGGRVYDPLGAQWLVPDLGSMRNLLQEPYNLHLHRFHRNDPINPFQEKNHLTDLKDWLSVVGFNTNDIMPSYYPEETCNDFSNIQECSPAISGISCAINSQAMEFYKLSTVPKTEVKISSTFSDKKNPRLTTIQSVLGDGILLSNNNGKALVNTVSDGPNILRDVVVTVFNETNMLNLYFSKNGQDSFFFVQEDASRAQRNWDQLQRLGTMFNITMHNVDPNEGSSGQVDIKLQSPSMILNIRYGTTVDDEFRRLVRLGKRRAVEEAWQQEKDIAMKGHKGMYEWSKLEKDELISSGSIAKYHGAYIHDVGQFPELVDDPNNIIFKKESLRKRRNRPRKPK